MSMVQEYIHNERDGGLVGHGYQRLYKFPNGYGASVITGGYGDIDRPYEVGVVKFYDDDEYRLIYDTPITDDVIGHLDTDGVNEVLNQIKELPNE